MQAEKMKPIEQLTLEPYERDHAVVVGIYRPPVTKKWICLHSKFDRKEWLQSCVCILLWASSAINTVGTVLLLPLKFL